MLQLSLVNILSHYGDNHGGNSTNHTRDPKQEDVQRLLLV